MMMLNTLCDRIAISIDVVAENRCVPEIECGAANRCQFDCLIIKQVLTLSLFVPLLPDRQWINDPSVYLKDFKQVLN